MSPRPLVIAHVLNGLRFGGNESLCLQLIKHSPADTRHVLFNLNPSRVEMKAVFMRCPDLTLVDRAYTRETRAAFIAGMALDLKRIAADGVLVYTFGVHVFVALAARAAGVRFVVARAGNPPPRDPQQRLVWKKIVWASRALRVPIMSCSGMVDRELRLLTGTLPRGSRALHNGVDVDAIEALAAEQRAKRQHGGPRVVGMVARLNSIKDHDTLLKAFARVQSELSHCELWLIGEGERRPDLEALADALKITASIRFLGERSDVHAQLGRMDVFVFSTTRDEGFGIAMAEAMAARTPIIASDVEACREVLGGGEAGRLVAPGNSDELAAAISTLLTQPDTAGTQVERAYARAKQHFDVKGCAAQYYDALGAAGKRASRG
jgi:glycosyltransferase involved in cell wall biosynthesis